MQTVLGLARSFLVEADPLKARFIEYGMAADFLTRLDALVTDFESHAVRRSTGATQRAADIAAINSALDELDGEIARYVAIVRNQFATDAATLAALSTASRLERARRRSNTDTPPPANPGGNAPTAVQ